MLVNLPDSYFNNNKDLQNVKKNNLLITIKGEMVNLEEVILINYKRGDRFVI
jgi:hypothetical protein